MNYLSFPTLACNGLLSHISNPHSTWVNILTLYAILLPTDCFNIYCYAISPCGLNPHYYFFFQNSLGCSWFFAFSNKFYDQLVRVHCKKVLEFGWKLCATYGLIYERISMLLMLKIVITETHMAPWWHWYNFILLNNFLKLFFCRFLIHILLDLFLGTLWNQLKIFILLETEVYNHDWYMKNHQFFL